MNCIITFDDGRESMRLFRLTKSRYLSKLVELEKEYVLEEHGTRCGITYWRAHKKQ